MQVHFELTNFRIVFQPDDDASRLCEGGRFGMMDMKDSNESNSFMKWYQKQPRHVI